MDRVEQRSRQMVVCGRLGKLLLYQAVALYGGNITVGGSITTPGDVTLIAQNGGSINWGSSTASASLNYTGTLCVLV